MFSPELMRGIAETVRALLPGIEQKWDRRHLDASLARYRTARKDLDGLVTGKPGRLPIHLPYVAKVLDKLAPEDAVFTADVRTPVIWVVRYPTMNDRRRLLGSFNHGSVGNALPQAIGAQISHRCRAILTRGQDIPLEICRTLRLDRLLIRMRKIGGQEGSCLASLYSRNLLGSSLSHNQSPLFAGAGSDVDDPIAAGDNVHIVLNHHHGIAGLHQFLQLNYEPRNIGWVQTRRRLVQDIERVTALRPLQLGGKLDALRFTA
jgi:hypothetical protein